uniref:Uncharacterized protein n=1 Tax=Aegilops tauschii subsp. strangulata TaxID=200361 RepID=A0A453SV43_AEGTS
MHNEFRKMANVVKNQVTGSYYMPDLTKPALARLSIYCNLRVSKYGVKKKKKKSPFYYREQSWWFTLPLIYFSALFTP